MWVSLSCAGVAGVGAATPEFCARGTYGKCLELTLQAEEEFKLGFCTLVVGASVWGKGIYGGHLGEQGRHTCLSWVKCGNTEECIWGGEKEARSRTSDDKP